VKEDRRHPANIMKCTRCRGEAPWSFPSHNAKFCPACFDLFFMRAAGRGLEKLGYDPKEPATVAVAVSGGKDSLACWDVLDRLGWRTAGLHLDLGLGGFSEASRQAAADFAARRGLTLHIADLKSIFGYTISELHKKTHHETCSLCGTLKRVFLNKMAVEHGFYALATGHNLDDEAARLLGNVMRHRTHYLEKFHPFLPACPPGQAARLKPLYRLEEREIEIYGRIRGVVSESGGRCPFAGGATSAFFKDALHDLEAKMPGTKRDFLFRFLRHKGPPPQETLQTCPRCGQPTRAPVCAACRIKARMTGVG
jgi:uncharacterized protein (TIGR00269 family)